MVFVGKPCLFILYNFRISAVCLISGGSGEFHVAFALRAYSVCRRVYRIEKSSVAT